MLMYSVPFKCFFYTKALESKSDWLVILHKSQYKISYIMKEVLA